MKPRIIAALFLAGFATASLAQGTASAAQSTAPLGDYDTPIVQDANSCPAGFVPTVPSYKFENGHLVRNGWLCESLYRDDHS